MIQAIQTLDNNFLTYFLKMNSLRKINTALLIIIAVLAVLIIFFSDSFKHLGHTILKYGIIVTLILSVAVELIIKIKERKP